MDLVTDARAKLAHLRIKGLKDILAQLNLAKTGKKQDLVDRISVLLSDENGCRGVIGIEEIVKIIDDTYRKIQGNGVTLSTAKSMISPNLNSVKPKVELDDAFQPDLKVRCPCGSSLVTDSMIKCEDSKCQVWQHLGCVMIPQKRLEISQPELPSLFYCELCRLSRSDPFCVTVRHLVLPLKLISGHSADRTKVIQSVEKTFTLFRADKELLQRTDYDLQVWCILLNDEVYFRMHWPLYSELLLNGFPIRTTSRAGQQALGINGRDDGPSLKTCAVEGVNKIFVSGCDDRVFCCGIRLVRRQTVQQVLSIIPGESEGESLKDALARVHRCILGGNDTENPESDSDIEVVEDSVTVNLRDPISGSRIRIAGRFKGCVHMGCFDLETFIILNQRSRKWQCPTCLKNYSLENIIIDPYFNRITSLMQNCGEDVNEVEVRPDGTWRVKNQGECSDNDLRSWHFPDGSLCTQRCGEQSTSEMSEGFTGLKFDLRRKSNGMWEVSKIDQRSPSSGNNEHDNCHKTMCVRSTSVTESGSYRGREDTSVNEGAVEIDSVNANVGQRDVQVIVISDSDEEDMSTVSLQGMKSTVPNPCDPSVSGDLELPNSGTFSLGFFNNNTSVFASPLWEMQSYPADFQLFHSDVNIPDALVDAPNSNAHARATTDVGGLMSDFGDVFQESNTECAYDAEMNGSLVDNPLAFGCNDPSLQIFLPTQPDSETTHAGMGEQSNITDGMLDEDWISLTLAAGGVHSAAARACRPNSRNGFFTDEKSPEGMDKDSGSFLLTLNNQNGYKPSSNTQKSTTSFSHSHLQRSARSRFVFSLDIDSDSQ